MTLQQLRYVTAVADCGSMNEAAKTLFVSQPGLSGAIKELEEETGIEIFKRTNKGVLPTPEGEEFLGYARQLLNQYELLEDRFIRRTKVRKKFSVSMQHYSFAVKAFVELVKQYGMDEYEFAVYETKTGEVISNVRNFRSEIGVLYENEFNSQALNKILKENNLEFHPLFTCGTYAYLWKNHPLAQNKTIRMEELLPYELIIPSRESRLQEINGWFGEGEKPIVRCRIAHMLNAYELTKRGVGITIYPAAAADLAEHSGICIRKITEPKVMASYVLIRNRSRALSRVAQEFFNYVEERTAANIVQK